jgi:hypothetical protein
MSDSDAIGSDIYYIFHSARAPENLAGNCLI